MTSTFQTESSSSECCDVTIIKNWEREIKVLTNWLTDLPTLTHSLHRAEYFLRSYYSPRKSSNSQPFMKPEGSLLCSEESPNLRPRVTFCNKLVFLQLFCQLLAQLPSWKTTYCWLSATAYSIYLQLPSISWDCLIHPQTKLQIKWH